MKIRTEETARIGIIGGTGVYDPEMLEEKKELKVDTPYGDISGPITVGDFKGEDVAFLPRHGKGHRIPPHKLPFRANIWAMKELGVSRILAPSAVGSLQEEKEPGDFVIPDQFIDRTGHNRPRTFYPGGVVAHISMADPFCPQISSHVLKKAEELDLDVHEEGTYVCIQGPRFSTRAESKMFRQWGGDIIGMTLVPEVTLAREAGICYTTIGMITDYDVWAEEPVTADIVAKTMRENLKKVKQLLSAVIPTLPKQRTCNCAEAIKNAFQ